MFFEVVEEMNTSGLTVIVPTPVFPLTTATDGLSPPRTGWFVSRASVVAFRRAEATWIVLSPDARLVLMLAGDMITNAAGFT